MKDLEQRRSLTLTDVKRENSYKRHVILVFVDKDHKKTMGGKISSLSWRFPTIKVKVVEMGKDWKRPLQHKVASLPTVILLKNGEAVDRLEGDNDALLEHLFRKAVT